MKTKILFSIILILIFTTACGGKKKDEVKKALEAAVTAAVCDTIAYGGPAYMPPGGFGGPPIPGVGFPPPTPAPTPQNPVAAAAASAQCQQDLSNMNAFLFNQNSPFGVCPQPLGQLYGTLFQGMQLPPGAQAQQAAMQVFGMAGNQGACDDSLVKAMLYFKTLANGSFMGQNQPLITDYFRALVNVIGAQMNGQGIRDPLAFMRTPNARDLALYQLALLDQRLSQQGLTGFRSGALGAVPGW